MKTTTAGAALPGVVYTTPRKKRVTVVGPGDAPGFVTLQIEGTTSTFPAPDTYVLIDNDCDDDGGDGGSSLQALLDNGTSALNAAITTLTEDQLDALVDMDGRMWVAASVVKERRRRAGNAAPAAVKVACPMCNSEVGTKPANAPGLESQLVMVSHKGAEGVLCIGSGRTVEQARKMLDNTGEGATTTTATPEPEPADDIEQDPTEREAELKRRAAIDGAVVGAYFSVLVEASDGPDEWMETGYWVFRAIKITKGEIRAERTDLAGHADVLRFRRKTGKSVTPKGHPHRHTIIDTVEMLDSPEPAVLTDLVIYGPHPGYGKAVPASDTEGALQRIRSAAKADIPALLDALELTTDDIRHRPEIYNLALTRILELDTVAMSERDVIHALMGCSITTVKIAFAIDTRPEVQEAILATTTAYGWRFGEDGLWHQGDAEDAELTPAAKLKAQRQEDPYAAGADDACALLPHSPDSYMSTAATAKYGNGWWLASRLAAAESHTPDVPWTLSEALGHIAPGGLDASDWSDEEAGSALAWCVALLDYWLTADHSTGTFTGVAPPDPPAHLRWWLDPFQTARSTTARTRRCKPMCRRHVTAALSVANWYAKNRDEAGYLAAGTHRYLVSMPKVQSTVLRELERQLEAYTQLDPLYERGRGGDITARDALVHLLDLQRVQKRPGVKAEIEAFLLAAFEWRPVMAKSLVDEIEGIGEVVEGTTELQRFLISRGTADTMIVMLVAALLVEDDKERRYTISTTDDVYALQSAWAWAMITHRDDVAAQLAEAITGHGGQAVLNGADLAWVETLGRATLEAGLADTENPYPLGVSEVIDELACVWSDGWTNAEQRINTEGADAFLSGDQRATDWPGLAGDVWRLGYDDAHDSANVSAPPAEPVVRPRKEPLRIPEYEGRTALGMLGVILTDLEARGIECTITLKTGGSR